MVIMDLTLKRQFTQRSPEHHVNTWERFQSEETTLLELFWDSNLTPISVIYLIFKLNYFNFSAGSDNCSYTE